MPYCPKCGVEVESQNCPLCNHKIEKSIHTVPFSHSVESGKREISLTDREKRRIFNASSIFGAVLISSICLTIDYLNRTITWAIYPMIAVLTMAMVTSTALYIHGYLKSILIFILSLLMLFSLDLAIPVKTFFMEISVPISITGALIAFILYNTIRRRNNPGINIPGFILIGITIFLIVVNLITHNFLYSEIRMTWSLITTVSILPVAVFLLYIHYVLSKRVDLKKIFHT